MLPVPYLTPAPAGEHFPQEGCAFDSNAPTRAYLVPVDPRIENLRAAEYAANVSRWLELPVDLEFKGVTAHVAAGSSTAEAFAAYKAKEFDAFAGNYRRDFIERFYGLYDLARKKLGELSKSHEGPLRVLDLGCGTGFVRECTFEGDRVGAYLGIDPSGDSLRVLHAEAEKSGVGAIIETRQGSAAIVGQSNVRDDIVEHLGGSPDLITFNTSFHVIAKTEPIGEVLAACVSLLPVGGKIVFGNYFHRDEAGFQAFRQAYLKLTTQEPSPPSQLFPPEKMQEMLEKLGLRVTFVEDVVANPDLPIRGYVMIAEKL